MGGGAARSRTVAGCGPVRGGLCMRAVLAVALAGLIAAGAAMAQSSSTATVRRAVDGEACPVPPPAWASPQERWAWGEICSGRVASMTHATGADDGKGCDAKNEAETWPPSRLVSARFVKLIATREPYVSAPSRPAVRLRCAIIADRIDLADEIIPQTLWLDESRMPEGVDVFGARFLRDFTMDFSNLGSGDFDAERARFEGRLSIAKGRLGRADFYFARFIGELRATGSEFGGKLSIESAVTDSDVTLSEVKVAGDLDLLAASVGGDLLLRGAEITGKLEGSEARVKGGVFGKGLKAGSVQMEGAEIGDDADFNDAEIKDTLNLDLARVGQTVYLSGEAHVGSVGMIGARVHGSVQARGLEVTGDFSADRIAAAGGIFLAGGARIGGIFRLLGAEIGQDVSLDGAYFEGSVFLDAARIAGTLFLRQGSRFADISLIDTDIGGGVQMQGSRFDGGVTMTGLRAGDLTLWQGIADTNWGPEAALVLRNAEVDALQARMPMSWTRDDATPLPVDLQGFRYQRLGGIGSGASHDLSRIDAGALVAWLGSPMPGMNGPAGYAPQPYSQLESVLRAMGADDAADEVAYARNIQRMDSRANTAGGRVAWAGDAALKWLVGFGVYPFRLLWWFAGLVVLGTFVARLTERLRQRGWTDCFWYSLENAFPLIGASRDHAQITHDLSAVQSFFHFQKVSGFVLATILVGALTLLGS